MIGLLGCGNALKRKQQAGIKIKPDVSMEHPGFILQHGVLVIAKVGQPFLNKLLQRRACTVGGHCEMEGGGSAHVVGEKPFDHCADLLGDVIGRAAKRIGNSDC